MGEIHSHHWIVDSTLMIATHETTSAFGKKLTVVTVEGQKYLIGVQIAALLKRETFNMYRSMKIKNIRIKRAAPEQVEYLCQCNAVRPGTHSVTLIPFDSGLYFVADAWARQHKVEGLQMKKQRSFITDKPKLHRRKPHPWNVHRSLKKDQLVNKNVESFMEKESESEIVLRSGSLLKPKNSPRKMPSLIDLQVASMDEISLEDNDISSTDSSSETEDLVTKNDFFYPTCHDGINATQPMHYAYAH